ncbi:hypothetical protein EIN_056710 [Entamoeba invadens IP1]|uniref:hypothetical protein n=1 Tax=Entamoeba invadens IP1 TaxID=370355 RepID=UPI0002C3E9AD|nr:hypothetical protein EIN_056710 [Entamoeba invadens IP1]ELP93286.1 hypothetical protein EIN_056710 [Entamoeba invadens IP1]|eukprot:XP_004260057.1 hypothetical protein EIN_056710 [Entamoeba invadens IP1]
MNQTTINLFGINLLHNETISANVLKDVLDSFMTEVMTLVRTNSNSSSSKTSLIPTFTSQRTNLQQKSFQNTLLERSPLYTLPSPIVLSKQNTTFGIQCDPQQETLDVHKKTVQTSHIQHEEPRVEPIAEIFENDPELFLVQSSLPSFSKWTSYKQMELIYDSKTFYDEDKHPIQVFNEAIIGKAPIALFEVNKYYTFGFFTCVSPQYCVVELKKTDFLFVVRSEMIKIPKKFDMTDNGCVGRLTITTPTKTIYTPPFAELSKNNSSIQFAFGKQFVSRGLEGEFCDVSQRFNIALIIQNILKVPKTESTRHIVMRFKN